MSYLCGIMTMPTMEGLLEEWRDGAYLEVAKTLERMGPKYVAQFCALLVRYEGTSQVDVLNKMMN
jgi:hypothetical protein